MALALYGRFALMATKVGALEEENLVLRERSERVGELEEQLARLRTLESKLLTIMGIDTLDVAKSRYGRAWPEGEEMAFPVQDGDGAGLVWPVTGAVSRGYKSGGEGGAPHLGLDIAARLGAPVRAALSGLVVFAGVDSAFGNMLVIDHGQEISTLYGHNAELFVKQGDSVERGEVIARLGSTGRSTAPHLHFEVREGGKQVDPLKYLPGKG